MKENNILVTLGTLIILLLAIIYTSYDDIKTKSVSELMYFSISVVFDKIV
jgi:hypothetical protein